MFCIFNLPHKVAKGQSQRQRHELARTSGQIASLAYHRAAHSPSSLQPSCSLLHLFLPALPPSHPPPPKGFWQAWTLPAWQEPQCSTSKESPLKYHFAISNPPRTLDPCHTATNTSAPAHAHNSGALSYFNQPSSRQSLPSAKGGVSRVLLGWEHRAREPASLRWGHTTAKMKGTSGLQMRETEASKENSSSSWNSMSISLLKFSTGNHRGAWNWSSCP